MKISTFILSIIFCPFLIYAQNICDIDINPVCSSETFDVEAPNSSFSDFIESCDGAIYEQENVAWYHVKILSGTTFTFLLEIQPGEDYDFAVWQNPNCENIGPATRATFIHEPLFGITQTGLMMDEEDECEGIGEDAQNTPGMVKHLDVQAGDDIYIMIYRPINPDPDAPPYGNFSVVFDGTGGNAVLDCTIVGNSYAKCDSDENGNEDFIATDFLSDLQEDYPNSTFEFYANNDDALEGDIVNSIVFPFNVSLEDSPQYLYVRVEYLNGEINRTIQLNLSVLNIPSLNNSLEKELCDENFDDSYQYNLTDLNPDLIPNFSQFTFNYYLSQADALGSVNEINQINWANYTIAEENLPFSIWVTAESENECKSIPVEVIFKKGQSVETNGEYFGPIGFCESEQIDLKQFESDISNNLGIQFSYFETMEDLQNNTNPIFNPENFSSLADGSVYVRIEKENFCSTFVEIGFTLNPNPVIHGLPTQIELCAGDTYYLEVFGDSDDVEFIWEFQSEISEGASININQTGIYSVTAINSFGCETIKELMVTLPPQPQITGTEIGPDYIIISAISGGETGNLDYSLDGIFWQTNPKFSNLIPGEIYTIYVREAGCMIDSYKVIILDVTNFISPNGDGKNDVWEIRGIQVTPKTTIKIFDRYGKIFVNTNFEGDYLWSGKYLGNPAPSGDYWYVIQVPSDGIVKPQKFVGHITVRN